MDIANFFVGYTAEQLIVMLVGAIIAFTQAFFPSISILEWLKEKLNLADTRMELVVITFFMVLSALAMWVTGELGSVEWSLEWLLANYAVFKAIAKIAYEMLKARNGI
ncbi:MAG: hypothetical protein GWN76_08485 [candidate division Zixibacteria bacterium]|nr:hypothetical protein [candidate division Zixibacteria bacterium]NIU14035.1 hypothetical protein [candidate division Zixibacteria bacterium]